MCYGYDVLGNLTRDTREQIAQIDRTVAGKVKSVTRTAGSTLAALTFGYGAHGHRIWKKNLQTGNTTFYVHDAQGNLMATYEAEPAVNSLALSEPILPPGLSTRMSRLGKLVKEDPEALSVQRRRVPKPKVRSLLGRPCARERLGIKELVQPRHMLVAKLALM